MNSGGIYCSKKSYCHSLCFVQSVSSPVSEYPQTQPPCIALCSCRCIRAPVQNDERYVDDIESLNNSEMCGTFEMKIMLDRTITGRYSGVSSGTVSAYIDSSGNFQTRGVRSRLTIFWSGKRCDFQVMQTIRQDNTALNLQNMARITRATSALML